MMLPEMNPNPEEPAPSEGSVPEELILPEGFTPVGDHTPLNRARRRRANRLLVPPGADERAVLLDNLAQRAFPSFEFFLYAFLCGTLLGAAYLLNAPALLLVGILLAPLLTPWVGFTLAAVTGSWRFFFLTFFGLLVAGALVFGTGALAGMAGRLWDNLPLSYARIHAQLWWPDLLVVALGAALLAISFIRSEQKPILASVMLAYGFFLPISAAGIGLGIGRQVDGVTLWPNGLLILSVHLALATLVGGIVLVGMHFKPVRFGGYLLPIFITLLSLAALVVLTGLVPFIRNEIAATRFIAPTPTALVLPSATPTNVPSPTPTPTNVPSVTSSPTVTFEPVPIYAMIASPSGGGALLRTEPSSGIVLAVLSNGILVEVLPEIQSVGTSNWVRVRALDNIEGWVLQTTLASTTLVPTPVYTITPTP